MKIYCLMTDEPVYSPITVDIILKRFGAYICGVSFPAGAANRKRIITTLRIYGIARFLKMAIMHFAWQAAGGRLSFMFRKQGIKVYPAKDVNSPEFIDLIKNLGADLIISFNCPQVLKKGLINTPKNGCINVHFGMLPKYRGIQPIMRAILNGDKEFGITVHYIDEKIDSGGIILQQAVPITDKDTLDTLYPKAFEATGLLLDQAVKMVSSGNIKRIYNDPLKKTYYSYPDSAVIKQYRRLWRQRQV